MWQSLHLKGNQYSGCSLLRVAIWADRMIITFACATCEADLSLHNIIYLLQLTTDAFIWYNIFHHVATLGNKKAMCNVERYMHAPSLLSSTINSSYLLAQPFDLNIKSQQLCTDTPHLAIDCSKYQCCFKYHAIYLCAGTWIRYTYAQSLMCM